MEFDTQWLMRCSYWYKTYSKNNINIKTVVQQLSLSTEDNKVLVLQFRTSMLQEAST